MNALQLVRLLGEQGITLEVKDDKLLSKAEKGALTPEWVAQIKALKSELMALLTQSQAVSLAQLLPPVEAGQWQDQFRPISYAQKRLWLLDRLQPGSTNYNMCFALEVIGRCNTRALEQAFGALFERHQVLRTVIVDTQAGPQQQINRVATYRLNTLTCSEAQLPQQLHQLTNYSFDLKSDLMLQVNLLEVSEDKSVLSMVLHHIASDGWSMDILIKELAYFYQCFCDQQMPELPPLEIQYGDYGAWQQQVLSPQVIEQALAHWRSRLEGMPQCHSLLTDKPRPVIATAKGEQVHGRLDAPLLTLCQAWLMQQGCSLNHLLKSCYALLLSRFSEQQQLVIGSPVANRPLKDLEALIGFFVNTLPSAFTLDPHQSAIDLIRATREQELADLQHQHLPFDLMVENFSPQRDLSHAPIFQLVFAMQNYQADAHHVAGVDMRLIAPDEIRAKFDLSLIAEEASDGIRLVWEYNSDLFERSTIEQMSQSYLALIEALLASPDKPVGELDWLSRGQRREIEALSYGPAVTEPLASMANFYQLLLQQSLRTPDAAAITQGESTLSYGEFVQRITAMAAWLQHNGVKCGDSVAILLPRSIELFVTKYALFAAGCCYIPLDEDYPAQRVEAILADSRPSMVICNEKNQRIFNLSAFNSVLYPTGTGLSHGYQQPVWDPQDVAYILYTSGTTGKPKGVALSQRGLLALASSMLQIGFALPGMRMLQFASCCFDATVIEWVTNFTVGGELVLLAPGANKDPALVSQVMQQHRLSHAVLPPSLLPYLDPGSLPDLQHLMTGGEAISLLLARHWQQGRYYYNGFGPTETTVAATVAVYRETPAQISLGAPLAGFQIRVVNEQLQQVPLGCPGELLIAGDGVALEYINRPELTAEKFVSCLDGERYYRSGDRVQLMPDGRLVYLGRIDQQVKIRGFRIELAEIEAQLGQLPEIELSYVCIQKDPRGEEQLVAYCQLGKAVITTREIRTLLKKHLPDYMIPGSFMLLAQLPLTVNNKIDTKSLPEASFASDEPMVAAATETENCLHGIWCELLGSPRLSVEVSFFDVGGHSLLMTRMLNQIEEKWQLKLQMQQIFNAPSIREIALMIDALSDSLTVVLALEEDELEGGFL